MHEDVVPVAGGRTVAFADFDGSGGTAVLWCHGGPGSRLEPSPWAEAARAAGLRLVGIDRPGYGLSPPQPGRSIADWVPDALVVADHLEIDRFVTVGVSTGGAYSLAVAAVAPERVLGVVACCSMTDMRHAPARATMSVPHTHAVWDAPDREAALVAATEAHGVDGSKLLGGGMDAVLPPSDQALFQDAEWLAATMAGWPAMFAQGLEGYTDDRLADGPGWVSFDVGSIRCPVTVLHGGSDRIADVVNAEHTARIVPGARLVVHEELGHFSIEAEIAGAVSDLLGGKPSG